MQHFGTKLHNWMRQAAVDEHYQLRWRTSEAEPGLAIWGLGLQVERSLSRSADNLYQQDIARAVVPVEHVLCPSPKA